MSNAPAAERVSAAQALEALESMDDICKMPYSIDPIGPYRVLQRYIEQQVANEVKSATNEFLKELEKHKVTPPIISSKDLKPVPPLFIPVGGDKLGYGYPVQTTNLPLRNDDKAVGIAKLVVNDPNVSEVIERGCVDPLGTMQYKTDGMSVSISHPYYSLVKCSCSYCTTQANLSSKASEE